MKLVNVRLDEEDARAVARLRAKGISLSDVVRRAVRAEDQRTCSKERQSEQIVAEALARFPTPRKAPRQVSALDRRAVQQLIRSRLRRSS
jgi:Arc/MetJ-type ribon-helix-helix transcriptional regulator